MDSPTVALLIRARTETSKKVSSHAAASPDLAEAYDFHLEAGLLPRSPDARQKIARILDKILPSLELPTALVDYREHLNLLDYEVRSLLSIDSGWE